MPEDGVCFAAAADDDEPSGSAGVADAVSVYITIDHAVIENWAERRNARPSTFMGNERPWPLLFDFGPPDAGVREIGWDEFFVEFERENVAFVYRDTDANGELDDFYEFISRATVPALMLSSKSTIRMYIF
jgi:hypothetical protein